MLPAGMYASTLFIHDSQCLPYKATKITSDLGGQGHMQENLKSDKYPTARLSKVLIELMSKFIGSNLKIKHLIERNEIALCNWLFD